MVPAPAVAPVSVLRAIGEIIYAGSATTLVTALAPHGSTALWGSPAATVLVSSAAVATEKEKRRR